MLNVRLRGLLALAVVTGSSLAGLAPAEAAVPDVIPVVPSGGCWTYEPSPGSAIVDLTGHVDVSTHLEPWTVPPLTAAMTFTTAGDNVVGGTRGFTVATQGGPAVTAEATATLATATYLVDVVDAAQVRASLDPIEVPLTVPAGSAELPASSAQGVVPMPTAGGMTLVLRGVIYDLPTLGQRVICNGQTEGVPLGTNPASAPVDSGVAASYEVLSGIGMSVDRVVWQRVTTAARAEGRIELSLHGFPSSSATMVALCMPAEEEGQPATCGTPLAFATDGAGAGSAFADVPADVVAGDGFVRATSATGLLTVDTSLQILGDQALGVHDNTTDARWIIKGDQWDPQKPVRLTLRDADGGRVGERVVVEAGNRGRIRAHFKVRDTARQPVEVRARQNHRAEPVDVTLDLIKAGLVAKPDKGHQGEKPDTGQPNTGSPNTGSPNTGSPNTGTPVPSVPAPTAAPAPVAIPEPSGLDVERVDGDPEESVDEAPDKETEPPTVANPGEIAIVEAELTGSGNVGDLFGAAPSRTLRLVAENVGEEAVRAPGLTISVGKDEVEPAYVSDGLGRLAPGETRVLEIPISLPMGAFGTYTVSGKIGDGETGSFLLTWQTYPWGLLALNALAVFLIVWALSRRRLALRPELVAALAGPADDNGTRPTVDGDAIVDLATLERWWELHEAGPAMEQADSEAAVVDLDAVGAWVARCEERDTSKG